jgi:hypothetical protein
VSRSGPGGHRIGVISDTHGRLDVRIASALAGADRILHAGDVGAQHVLWELETVAPVTAVLGNTDSASTLPDLEGLVRLKLDGVRIVMVHDKSDLPGSLVAESDVVVFGHSHRPLVQLLDGVLWLNPGSATSPRGAPQGKSVALLEWGAGREIAARIVSLDDLRSLDG